MENTEQSQTPETTPVETAAETLDVSKMTTDELEAKFNEELAKEQGNSETESQDSSTEEQPVTEKPAETQAEKPVQSQPDYERQYKELQAEFTRTRQEIAELKKQGASKSEQQKVESKLAQIRKENPEAATIFDELKQEVREELRKEMKPIEERVVLRAKRENIESFTKAAEDFKKSELSELQPELDKILHEVSGTDEQLYGNIEDNPGFFDYAMSVLMYRHRDKVKEIILKNASKTSKPNITAEIKGNPALRKSGASTVAGKSVASKEDAMKNFSLEELEAMLPKTE